MIENQGYAITRASAAAGRRANEVRRDGDACRLAHSDRRGPSRCPGEADGGVAGGGPLGRHHGLSPTDRPVPAGGHLGDKEPLEPRGDLQGVREGLHQLRRSCGSGLVHELASNKSSRCHPYGIAHRERRCQGGVGLLRKPYCVTLTRWPQMVTSLPPLIFAKIGRRRSRRPPCRLACSMLSG
jgi:hypothetical protein